MSRNLLDRETSPYLLQHRDNPVHWRPWGPTALQEAQDSNRPILLSVGYAACHWCHVMAHESFENQDTAALMNRLFVPIKVDREERPDIDSIYQSALALLGQQGGWPLTMFLTPQGEPFWGGTYFPPVPRYGRPSFRDILTGVASAWAQQPDKINNNVTALRAALADQTKPESGEGLSMALLDRAAQTLLRSVDLRHGGLTGAPKFPHVPLFTLLWRAGLRNDDPELKQAVITTLNRMCQGGIYDHLGGGFSRYSTDEEWLAPHFEKMLYDNAQMVELLTLVAKATGEPLFAERVAETIGWLLREMKTEDGAFAATLDADSEGEEGRYYVWRIDQLEDALPPALHKPFFASYDVSARGNWEGKIILNRSQSQPLPPLLEQQMVDARAQLLALRAARIPPARDDKVLADWNGLMIAALTKAALAFDRPDWLDQAKQAFAAIQRQMMTEGRLAHSLRLGRVQPEAMLDDYVQMARAAITLYEATGEYSTLIQAEAWADQADRHYWDPEHGGYFFTADDAPGLILRSKTALDNATPSGNGSMVEVMARLFFHSGKEQYRQRAETIVSCFSGEMNGSFPNMASLLNGWELLIHARQLVIVARLDDPTRHDFLRVAADYPDPNLILQILTPDQSLPSSHPAAEKIKGVGEARAFLCNGPVCTLPLTTIQALSAALAQP